MKLTGVGGTFCASHNSPEGVLHGHSYEVRAWFRKADARPLQKRLQDVLAKLDHSHLAGDLVWAEEIAESIAHDLPGCVEVEISRPLERLYARWRMA
jgi:6-pyruvoyl-tetrahydropterin synthase